MFLIRTFSIVSNGNTKTHAKHKQSIVLADVLWMRMSNTSGYIISLVHSNFICTPFSTILNLLENHYKSSSDGCLSSIFDFFFFFVISKIRRHFLRQTYFINILALILKTNSFAASNISFIKIQFNPFQN